MSPNISTLYCNKYARDDVIKWKHFPRFLPMVKGIHRSPVECPPQRPMTRSFDVFFDLCLNKRLSKQSKRWWFETPPRSVWRHCNCKWSHGCINNTTWDWLPNETKHKSCANLLVWYILYIFHSLNHRDELQLWIYSFLVIKWVDNFMILIVSQSNVHASFSNCTLFRDVTDSCIYPRNMKWKYISKLFMITTKICILWK